MYILFVLYLLIKSHFFGLLNTRFILIGGVPLLNIADLALLFIVILKWRSLVRVIKEFRIHKAVLGLVVFFLFFLVYSKFVYSTTYRDILTNFSDFWSFFFFLFLLIAQIQDRAIENVLTYFCWIIGSLFILHKVTNFSFGTFQISQDAHGRIPLVFNAVFPLFFTIKSYRLIKIKKYKVLLLTTIFTGYVLWESEFRSLFLSIPLILFLNLFLNTGFSYSSKKILILFGFLSLLILGAVSIDNIFKDDAITSRIYINAERIDLLQKKPLFGYGFIGKESQVGKQLMWDSISRFNSTIKVIDAGYLDLMLRFGIIGVGVYLFLLFKLADFKIYITRFSEYEVYILSLLMVSLTLSVLSFEVGLLPFFIAAYLNLQHKKDTVI